MAARGRYPHGSNTFLLIRCPARSIEVSNGLDTLRKQLRDGELREYVLSDFLLLYTKYGQTVYLHSIKHHRQLSFDFENLWVAGQAHSDNNLEDK